MKPDPDLGYFGHPLLPCGYNSDDNNGDDLNGSGTNWPVWPVLFDTFEGLVPLIITDEMLDEFKTACPDYVVACDPWVVTPPAVDPYLTFEEKWGTLLIPAEGNTFVVPYQRRELEMKKDWRDAELRGVPGTTLLSRKATSQVVRKKP